MRATKEHNVYGFSLITYIIVNQQYNEVILISLFYSFTVNKKTMLIY